MTRNRNRIPGQKNHDQPFDQGLPPRKLGTVMERNFIQRMGNNHTRNQVNNNRFIYILRPV